MTTEEVRLWIAYHRSIIPTWGNWLDSLPDKREMINRIGTVFKDVALSAAKEASTSMLHSVDQPNDMKQHASWVSRIALQATNTQNIQSFTACSTCYGVGHVHYFAGSINYVPGPGKKSIRDIYKEAYKDNIGLKRIVAINCHCNAARPAPSGIPESCYRSFVPWLGQSYFRGPDGTVTMIDKRGCYRSFMHLSDEEQDIVMNGPAVENDGWYRADAGSSTNIDF